MEEFDEPKFVLPTNWADNPQTKCYTHQDPSATFCYREGVSCFIDPPPNETPFKDGKTNYETAEKLCAVKEKPVDLGGNQTAAMEIVPNKARCHTNLEMGDASLAGAKLFDVEVTYATKTGTYPTRWDCNLETKGTSCAKVQPFDVKNANAAKDTSLEQKELPLRLHFGNGPRIHRKLCIDEGVVDKRCEDCGQVGMLTCFSQSFRKWALKRVTEEEFNKICSRCRERGHTCLDCDIPITSRLVGEAHVPRGMRMRRRR